MGVTINSRKYENIFRPQDTNIDWLLGNVGVWQKLKLDVSFSVEVEFTTTNVLFIDQPNLLTLTNGKTWNEYGFSNGMEIVLEWEYVATTVSPPIVIPNALGVATPVKIMNIHGDKAEVWDVVTNQPLSIIPIQSGIAPITGAGFEIRNVKIFSNTIPQGIQFTYGHIDNSTVQSNNLASFIDGTFTSFLVENTDTMTIGQVKTMDAIGNQSGMSIASCNIEYKGNSPTGFRYEIQVVFMLSSFFEDINTFINFTSPSVTFDASSLTDNFEVVGFPVFNNPNVEIKNDLTDTQQFGNTGWFDENYNGLANPFTVSSITYTNLAGDTVSELDFKNPIKVTAVIDNVPNAVSARCGYGFSLIPIEETDYKQNQYSFYKNLKMNTGGNASAFQDVFNASNVIDPTIRTGYSKDNSTMNVSNLRFRASGATQITFEALFTPSADFITEFTAKDITERYYILWVSVADQSEVTNFSNRVSLLLDFNQMDSFVQPVGAYAGMTIDFLDHSMDENHVFSGCPYIVKYVEDDILARVKFQIDTATGVDIPTISSLSYGFFAERITDGFQYELDKYQIDLTQYPDPTQFSFDASRGFKLGAGNNKNFVKVEHLSALDSGTKKGVLGLYGFKIRWEDWIARLNVPIQIKQDFYDASLKVNGISNDWYRYLSNAGYNFYFYVYLDGTLNGQPVRYINKKHLVFEDYSSPTLTTYTYIRESDGTVLNGGTDPVSGLPLGVFIEGEKIRIEVLYTKTVGTFPAISSIYGTICSEVDEGAGQFEFRQLSSIMQPEADNPLEGISGTLLDIQLLSPTQLKMSCLVNVDELIDADRYKISSRSGYIQ